MTTTTETAPAPADAVLAPGDCRGDTAIIGKGILGEVEHAGLRERVTAPLPAPVVDEDYGKTTREAFDAAGADVARRFIRLAAEIDRDTIAALDRVTKWANARLGRPLTGLALPPLPAAAPQAPEAAPVAPAEFREPSLAKFWKAHRERSARTAAAVQDAAEDRAGENGKDGTDG